MNMWASLTVGSSRSRAMVLGCPAPEVEVTKGKDAKVSRSNGRPQSASPVPMQHLRRKAPSISDILSQP
jgi:hypothetical protein